MKTFMRVKFKPHQFLTTRIDAMSSQLYAAAALFLGPNEIETTGP